MKLIRRDRLINILILSAVLVIIAFIVSSIINKNISKEKIIKDLIITAYSEDFEVVNIDVSSLERNDNEYIVRVNRKLKYKNISDIPFIKGIDIEYENNYKDDEDIKKKVDNVKLLLSRLINKELVEFIKVEAEGEIYTATIKGEKISIEDLNRDSIYSSKEKGKEYLINFINDRK
ncbi:MAG TPA: hypothetical protein VIG40_05245 [Tissierellaceae bacterium]